MNDFYEAWQYLLKHSYYDHQIYGNTMSAFPASLYIEVVKVNPDNLTIEDDDSKNTLVQVWLESGCWLYAEDSRTYEICHDPGLDIGGNTFEEAIINLSDILKSNELSR